jgi:uncharacterized protein (DUF1501 family)
MDTTITKDSMPDITIGGPNDAAEGRLLPTTSIDEYSSTVLKWFGVPEVALDVIIPNLHRFTMRDLGFMS